MRDERGCPNATKTKNLKVIILFLTVILYAGLVTNVGFAQESVKTELKEAATPRPPTEPTPSPEPPFELDNDTKAIMIDLLSKEFNKTADEIDILSAGETYEEGRIVVRTNLGTFTYKDKAIYPTGLRLESKFSAEEATHIIKSKLADEGVDIDSAVFYGQGSRILNESLCRTYYDMGSDLNYYPGTQICDFYFLRSIDEKKAVYEYWGFTFDAETGEVYRQEKEGPAVFKSVKTREDAVRVLKEQMNISVDPSKVFLNPNPDGWHYIIPLNEAVGLRLYDDGTIKQLRWDVITERSSSPGIRVIERSKSPFTPQIVIGLLLILVIIGRCFTLKKRGIK